MATVERELIDKISRLSPAQQRQVLEFVWRIEQTPQANTYSARELLKLPAEERDRLVAAAFESAADEDFETFEAYSEEEG